MINSVIIVYSLFYLRFKEYFLEIILLYSIGWIQVIYSCRLVSDILFLAFDLQLKLLSWQRLFDVYSLCCLLIDLVFGLLKLSFWENSLSKSSPLQPEQFYLSNYFYLIFSFLLEFYYIRNFPFIFSLFSVAGVR